MQQFTEIYLPLLNEDSRVHISESSRGIEQECGTEAIYHRLNLLPFAVQNELHRIFHRRLMDRQRDVEECLFMVAHRHDVGDQVGSAVSQIVSNSSLWQTMKYATRCIKSILKFQILLKKCFYCRPKQIVRIHVEESP